MTPEDQSKLSDILVSLLPKDGKTIGNLTLSDKFIAKARKGGFQTISNDDYWEIRNILIDQNQLAKGRGKGGSVYRIIEEDPQILTKQEEDSYSKEMGLYDPLRRMLYEYWPKENNINNFILETTAMQGRKNTGGRWTRPDIAIVSVNTYSYLPGKYLEITTFEIKPKDIFDITGVFEAAAHRAFAHYAYLTIHTSERNPIQEDFERLKSECRRLGVGLITFTDPEKYETLEIVIDPDRSDPPPYYINDFIHRQITQEKQTKLLEMIK